MGKNAVAHFEIYAKDPAKLSQFAMWQQDESAQS
jgi:hypothetical protein